MLTYSKYSLLFSLALITACAHAESSTQERTTETAVMAVSDAETPPADSIVHAVSNKPAEQPLTKNSVVQATNRTKAQPKAVTKAKKSIAEPSSERQPAETQAQGPSHEDWNKLLREHVTKDGKVDYTGFQKDKSKLKAYLDQLAQQRPQPAWGRNTSLAYWINAYNAFTVKLILDHYPVNSIRDIYDGNPWDVKWIALEGKTLSLNQIEHEIIRKRFDEARIHFAVNCAARSCPPLINRAFTSENLNTMLEEATLQFLNNTFYNKIDPEKAQLSKIFDWYGSDFGNINKFLEKYIPNKISPDTPISFMEYDWALNQQ